MRPYAAAQHIGGRSHQCDATAVRSNPRTGARAFAILDGIGSSDTVRDFSRTMATRLARAGARHGDAETALRRLHARVAAEPGRPDTWGILPCAAALVIVVNPTGTLTVAWAGDCRAYLLTSHGTADRLTRDHNRRRVIESMGLTPRPGARNLITSYLGGPADDHEVMSIEGHPAIESAYLDDTRGLRLILATDGAYEPLEDSCRDLAAYGAGAPREAARDLVADAVALSTSDAPDNATVLVADLP